MPYWYAKLGLDASQGSVAKVESEAQQFDNESISDEVSHMRIHVGFPYHPRPNTLSSRASR